jgi:hypothetical protein
MFQIQNCSLPFPLCKVSKIVDANEGSEWDLKLILKVHGQFRFVLLIVFESKQQSR